MGVWGGVGGIYLVLVVVVVCGECVYICKWTDLLGEQRLEQRRLAGLFVSIHLRLLDTSTTGDPNIHIHAHHTQGVSLLARLPPRSP